MTKILLNLQNDWNGPWIFDTVELPPPPPQKKSPNDWNTFEASKIIVIIIKIKTKILEIFEMTKKIPLKYPKWSKCPLKSPIN